MELLQTYGSSSSSDEDDNTLFPSSSMILPSSRQITSAPSIPYSINSSSLVYIGHEKTLSLNLPLTTLNAPFQGPVDPYSLRKSLSSIGGGLESTTGGIFEETDMEDIAFQEAYLKSQHGTNTRMFDSKKKSTRKGKSMAEDIKYGKKEQDDSNSAEKDNVTLNANVVVAMDSNNNVADNDNLGSSSDIWAPCTPAKSRTYLPTDLLPAATLTESQTSAAVSRKERREEVLAQDKSDRDNDSMIERKTSHLLPASVSDAAGTSRSLWHGGTPLDYQRQLFLFSHFMI